MSGEPSGNAASVSGDGASTGTNGGAAVDTNNVAPVSDLAGADKPKRRGGWPAGKPRGTGGGSDNHSAGGGASAGSASGGRKTAAQKETLDLSGIEAALVGIHAGLAMLTKNPVWEMPKQEAESVAKAVANVARHYPKLAGHEKLVDWVMLIQALGMAYGTRIYLTMPDKKAEKKEPPKNVSLFPGAV